MIRSAGGFRATAIHPMEQALMRQYHLSGLCLHRLAVFILAHTMVDQVLTSLLIFHKLAVQSAGSLTVNEKNELLRKIARTEFGRRLDWAKSLLSVSSYNGARSLNSARNDFLHRHRVPLYKGKMVTSDAGLRKALSEAHSFIREVAGVFARVQRAWRTQK